MSYLNPAGQAGSQPDWTQPAAAQPGPLERPEVLVGAAFAGAFLIARILKRLVD